MTDKIRTLVLGILEHPDTEISEYMDKRSSGFEIKNRELNLSVFFYDLPTTPKRYFIELEPYIPGLGRNQKPAKFEIKDKNRVSKISEDLLMALTLKSTKGSPFLMRYVELFGDYLAGKPIPDNYKFKQTTKRLELRQEGVRTVPYIELPALLYLLTDINSKNSDLYPKSLHIKNVPPDKSNLSYMPTVRIWFNGINIDKYPVLNNQEDLIINGLCETEDELFEKFKKFDRVKHSPVMKSIFLDMHLNKNEDNSNTKNKIKI